MARISNTDDQHLGQAERTSALCSIGLGLVPVACATLALARGRAERAVQVIFGDLPEMVRYQPLKNVLVVAEGRHVGLDRRKVVLSERQEDAGDVERCIESGAGARPAATELTDANVPEPDALADELGLVYRAALLLRVGRLRQRWRRSLRSGRRAGRVGDEAVRRRARADFGWSRTRGARMRERRSRRGSCCCRGRSRWLDGRRNDARRR